MIFTEKRFAKIIDDQTKEVEVGIGWPDQHYIEIGMIEMLVDLAYNGKYYISGYAPNEPEPSESEKIRIRVAELKSLLAEKDYIGVKIATGCATIEDYAKEIAQCESWREEIRSLENGLNENSTISPVGGV